jgi:SAM-dependent methyltransferase
VILPIVEILQSPGLGASGDVVARRRRWNHNIHYHPLIHRAVPVGCERALDVGCGEGMLARELRRRIRHVSAIDRDQTSIDRARARDSAAGDVDYVVGDFLSHPFPTGSFDLVVSVAALHHMDATAGLTRMRLLLRPGGTLVVVGLARSRLPRDLPFEIAAVLSNAAHRMTKDYWEQTAPTVWPPPLTYAQMRRVADRVLPGVRFRHHVLWRYSLTWTKPTE